MGRFCNKNCLEWRAATQPLPSCTCEMFCHDKCFAPSCDPCEARDLPLWIRTDPGPLGTGLLCCDASGTVADPCCTPEHAELGTCCVLEVPTCDCSIYSSSAITLESFNPAHDVELRGFLALIIMAVPVVLMCRRPLPSSRGPRGADVAMGLSYIASVFLVALSWKWYWQRHFKPAELVPGAVMGHLSAFTLACVLLPLDRTHLISAVSRIPFERIVKVHRAAGRCAVLCVVLHGIFEARALGKQIWTFEMKPWGFGNCFGFMSGLCCVALFVCSTDVLRRSKYELFLVSHRLFAVCIFLTASLHCFEFATLALVCSALHGISWLSRLRRRRRVLVLRAKRSGAAESDSEALLLKVEHVTSETNRGDLPPGTWFLLQVPCSREWHPYSLAMCESGTFTFLVKNMGEGSWSSRVVGDVPAKICLEGPYGGPGFFPGHCRSLLLVCGGVGLSPLARLWQRPPPGVERVELIWVVRCPEAMDWLTELVPDHISGACHAGFIQVFLTRSAVRERSPAPTWAAGITKRDAITGRDAAAYKAPVQRDASPASAQDPSPAEECWDEVELEDAWTRQQSWEGSKEAVAHSSLLSRRAAELTWNGNSQQVGPFLTLHSGRPNLEKLFDQELSRDGGSEIGVIACGPQPLVEYAQTAAYRRGLRFHTEEFSW